MRFYSYVDKGPQGNVRRDPFAMKVRALNYFVIFDTVFLYIGSNDFLRVSAFLRLQYGGLLWALVPQRCLPA
jgi:hypothetical protein